METTSNRFSLAVFCLFAFISMLGMGISFPTFSFITLKPGTMLALAGASDKEKAVALGALLAIAPLISFFVAPYAGMLADQKGRKSLLIAALVLLIIGTVSSAIGIEMKSLSILLLSRVIIGVGSGGAAALNAAIADISPPEKKAKNYALLNTTSSLGFMVGPLIGGKLSQGGSYDAPFLLAAGLTSINLILLIFGFKDRFQPKIDDPSKKTTILSSLKSVFHYPNVRTLLLCAPLFAMGFVIYWQFIGVNWIEEYKLTEAEVGDAYAYGAFVFVLSSGFLIRPILSRFRDLPLVFFSSLLLSCSILILLFRTGLALFWFTIPIQEFSMAILGPTAMGFLSNAVKQEDQGKLMGVVQSMAGLGFALAPLLGGFVAGINYNAHILVGGLLVLLFTFLILVSYRTQIFVKRT